ncbi:hypothetical protein LWI29_014983 [Acer saccharum]|uniref:Uncharacterized protein n=1 Tax=Acer saccharum TaxID=4024 RepID=A0AA39VZJ8_ACESA|nr:hypothetical protein LWI29_014983 [Acer saccharum]
MEPHLDHGPLHEQEPHHTSVGPGHHTVAEGDQGEQHHEKKSVFTKVKAKAKKMKDKLTGHGHGYEHDLDEEDDEDDQEKFEDPQIHDSPKYDSAASKTTAGQVGNLETSGVNHGRSTAMDVDPLKPNVKPGSNFHGQEGTKGQHKVTLGSVMDEDVTHASQNKPVTHYDDATTGIHDHKTEDNVPSSTLMGDLPHGPPFDPPGIFHDRDNVPVKGDVLDPPGIHHHSSRDNVPSTRTSVAICDDNIVVRPGIHHNSRDDVPSRTTPQQDRSGQTKDNLERPKGLKEDFAAPKDSSGDYTSANHQTKVTDPTGKGGEAAEVTSILPSFEKMKVKDESEGMGKTRKEHNLPAARNEDLPTSVASTGSHDQFSPELNPPKPFTAGETFDSTKPQEHDHKPSNQSSSYTGKSSSPTTAIADKAVSAKNVEGDKDNTTVHDHEGVGGRPSSDQSGYTEKLSYATSAIADRAISAKNVVASKLGYGEKDNTEVPGTGTFSTANQQQQKQQHGVEQQQLKQEEARRPAREVVSDAMHKRNDDQDLEVNRPMGKVTQSERVPHRLGNTKDDQALGNKGMVDKIKGAVGSWLGKEDQSHPGIHHNSRDDVPSRTTPQQDRSGQTKVNLERPKGPEEDFAAPKDSSGDYTSSNHQTKVTDPTGNGGEAAGVTSILQSLEKMKVEDGSEGMGKTRQEHDLQTARNEDHLHTGSHDQFSPELTSPKPFTAGRETFDSTKPQEHDHKPSNQSSSYTDKNSFPTTAIADKAVSAKNVVGDKDNTTGVHDHEGVGGRPSSDQSGYTEKLSYATSVIADRAISAKNVVALKLGYGEKDNEVPGTGTYSTANQQQQQQQHSVEGNNHEKGGGGSLKGYLAEKLKPGEEDKALSEVITESLHKRKPEQQQKQEAAPRPVGEVISDAMHKRNDDPDGEVSSRPMGKVTESEEVARRLGNTKDDQALGNKGMVDKIKGAVGSWLGTGDQSPGSQRSQPGPASDDTGHTSN